MKLYPNDAGSELRLRFGARLARGLRRSAATAPLAAGVDAVQKSLEDAFKARQALMAPVEYAADDLRFAELDAERHIRRCHARCRELDGDRAGAITNAVFPNGLTAEVAPKGQEQAKAIDALRTRIEKSNNEKLAAHRAELVAMIDAANKVFRPAYDAWVGAVQARDAAFSVERIRRDEHRRTIDAVFGGIRQAFPDDPAMREAIVPRLQGRRRAQEEADDGDDDAGAGEGGAPGGGGPGTP